MIGPTQITCTPPRPFPTAWEMGTVAQGSHVGPCGQAYGEGHHQNHAQWGRGLVHSRVAQTK